MAETFTRVSVGVGVADGVVMTSAPDAELPELGPGELAERRAKDAIPQPPKASTLTAAIAITMRHRRATEKLRHPPFAMSQC